MSDRDDLKGVQSFLSELIANLKTATVREGARDAAGGLFPNGVNDIFAKLTVGGITLELEVSASNSIHAVAPPLAPVQPGLPEGPISPKPQQAVRPMYIVIPPQSPPVTVDLSFTVTDASGHKKAYGPTQVVIGTTEFDLNTGQVTGKIPE